MKTHFASLRSNAALFLRRIAPTFLAHVAFRPHEDAFSMSASPASAKQRIQIMRKGSYRLSKWLRGWRLQ